MFARCKSRLIEGWLYFVTFIGDCSRKVWAFTLISKDQTLDTFKFFDTYVKTVTKIKLKCV